MRLGNFLGNCDSRIGVIPIKTGVFRINSMVSGPTNHSSADVFACRPASDSPLRYLTTRSFRSTT